MEELLITKCVCVCVCVSVCVYRFYFLSNYSQMSLCGCFIRSSIAETQLLTVSEHSRNVRMKRRCPQKANSSPTFPDNSEALHDHFVSIQSGEIICGSSHNAAAWCAELFGAISDQTQNVLPPCVCASHVSIWMCGIIPMNLGLDTAFACFASLVSKKLLPSSSSSFSIPFLYSPSFHEPLDPILARSVPPFSLSLQNRL